MIPDSENAHDLMKVAVKMHQAGDLNGAEKIYTEILARDPGNAFVIYNFGIALRAQGRSKDAIEKFTHATRLNPSYAAAWSNLADVLIQTGKLDNALEAYNTAIDLEPNNVSVRYNLANILYKHEKYQEAVSHYLYVTKLNPEWADPYCNLGNALFAVGEMDAALDAYGKALKLNPDYVEIHCNIANVLQKQGKSDEALAYCKKTVDLKPDYADGHYNLGNRLSQAGRFEEALASYSKAVNTDPGHVNAFYNMGDVFLKLKRYIQAVNAYKDVIQIQPNHVEAYLNTGYSLTELNRLQDAQACYERALASGLNDPRLYCNLGNVFAKKDRYVEAVDAYERALRRRRDFEQAYLNLAAAHEKYKDMAKALTVQKKAIETCPPSVLLNNLSLRRFIMHGLWDEGEPLFEKVVNDPYHESDIAHLDKALFVLNASFLPWKKIFAKHLEWGRLQMARCKKEKIGFSFTGRERNGSPRIGYLSPDFRCHSVGFFFKEIISHHDTDSFPIYCYSLLSQEDHITSEIECHATAFKRVGHLEPNEIARQIYEDRIDILVDLSGHTKANRLEVLGYNPAPIQVTALGYPNGTGLPTVDYRISDTYAESASADEHYLEKLVRLPKCFLPFIKLPVSEKPFSKEDFGLPSRSQTLVSFNALHKLNPRVLHLWNRILKALPDAYLLLSFENSHIDELKNNIKKYFQDNIDRVVVLPRAESPEIHRARYKMADIALDTFPYSGTTTSYEALYMGVPIVTLVGERHVQRTTYSFLKNIGLDEAVAYSEQEYVEKVIRMAVDKNRRALLKAKIKKNLCIPQLGPEMYTRYLEKSYLEMWFRSGYIHY